MTFPQLGDLIEVGDQAYMHGTGHLVLRVTRIGDQVRLHNDEWLKVGGLALRADGTQLDPNLRPALARICALRIGSAVEVVVSTTCLAVALEEVDRAQAEIERHPTVRPCGECVTCGEVEPCSGRRAAVSR